MTREEAITLYESKFYEEMSSHDIALFQLSEDRLCMPFDVFHEAIEYVLDRPVWTHEFGLNLEGLKAEMEGKISKPTLKEIIGLIPEEKRLISIVVSEIK